MLPSRPVTKDQRQDESEDDSGNTRPASDGHGRQFSHHGTAKRDGYFGHNPLPQDHGKLQVSLALQSGQGMAPGNPRKLLSAKRVARKGYSRSHARPGPKTADHSKLGEGAPIMAPTSTPLVLFPNDDKNFLLSPFIPPGDSKRDTRGDQTQADKNAASETNVKHKPSTQNHPNHFLPGGPTIPASQGRAAVPSKNRSQARQDRRTASSKQAHSSCQHGSIDDSVSEEHLSKSAALLPGSHGISASGGFPPKLAPEFTESRFALDAYVDNHPRYLLNSPPPSIEPATYSPRRSHKTDMDAPPSQSAWIQRRRERLGIIPPRPIAHNPSEPSKLHASSKITATSKAQVSPDSAKALIDLTLSDDEDDDKAQAHSTRNVAQLGAPAIVPQKRPGNNPRPTHLLHNPKTCMRSNPMRDGSVPKLENQQPTPFPSTSPMKRSFSGTDDSDWPKRGQPKKARKASYQDSSPHDSGQRQEAGDPQIAVSAYGPSRPTSTDLDSSDRPRTSQLQTGDVNNSLMPPKLQNPEVVVLPNLTGRTRRSALRYNTFLRRTDVTIGEAVYGPANSPNRPDSAAVRQPNSAVPDQKDLVVPGYAHFDPRVHWTWEYSRVWYAKKMKEVSRRGNRKSRSRFAQAKASLQRRLDEEKQKPHGEFPQKVLDNPDWLAAARELREMKVEVDKMAIVEPTKCDEFMFVKSSGFVDE